MALYKRLIPLLLIIALALCSCARGEQKTSSDMPSPETGFFNSSQIAEGGAQPDIDDANLNTIGLANDGTDALINLTFILGSEMTGEDVASISNVPKYTAYCLQNPSRFVVRIEGLKYWDYDSSIESQSIAPVFGFFKQISAQMDSGDKQHPFYLYFNLESDVSFQIQENKDSLAIRLRPIQNESKTSNYVVANSFFAYQSGKIPDDLGFTPSLYSDLIHYCIISKPFDSAKDAEDFMVKAESKLKALNISTKLKSVELKSNELPPYDGQTNDSYLHQNIILHNGKAQTLPVIMADGTYLCTSVDGKKQVFSKRLKEDESALQDEESFTLQLEQLWLMENNKAVKMNLPEFDVILDAAFSQDAKRLAFLENSEDAKILHIFDMEKHELMDLSEDDFGNNAVSFAWGDNSDILYIVGGNEESTNIMKCDLSSAPGSRMKVLNDTQNEQNYFSFLDGKLLFSASYSEDSGETSASGTIYSLDPGTGTMEKFADGDAFQISPNGKKMGIINFARGQELAEESAPTEDESMGKANLELLDINSGDKITVTEGAQIMSIMWAPDTSTMYYICKSGAVASGPEDQEGFDFSLWQYELANNKAAKLLDITTSDMRASMIKGQFYVPMMFYFTEEDSLDVPFVTYLLDLAKIQ